jgi:hypothetical protein
MQWVPGVDADHAYAELASRARTVNIDDIALVVCSLADLRKMKQAAGRRRDLDDLEKLSAVDDA